MQNMHGLTVHRGQIRPILAKLSCADARQHLHAQPAFFPASALSSQRRPPRMVDLGCGDLALLAPLLRRLPLGSYTGLDLTAQVLPLAQQGLGDVP